MENRKRCPAQGKHQQNELTVIDAMIRRETRKVNVGIGLVVVCALGLLALLVYAANHMQ